MLNPEQLRIVRYPDPVLRRAAGCVPRPSELVRAVALKMIRLMHGAGGVGLAAPQVGLSWRLFVANPDGQAGADRVFLGPVLSRPSRETVDREEGCLSLPQVTGQIRRPATITVDAADLDGNAFTLTSGDLAARVWQHEVDHLDGRLIIDRMTPIDRMANRQALRQLEDAARAVCGGGAGSSRARSR